MNTKQTKEENSDDELVRALRKIERIITECPKETLLEIFEKHRDMPLAAGTLAFRIEEQISHLECMVELGNDEAAEVLRDIGLRIARFLSENSIMHEDDKIAANSENVDHSQEGLKYSELSLQGFDQEIYEELHVIWNLEIQELNKIFEKVGKQFDPDSYMLDLAVGMFTDHTEFANAIKEFYNSAKYEKHSKEKYNFSHKCSEVYGKTKLILHCILERRARHLKSQTLKNIARNSYSWPAEISADVSQREEDLSQLLGGIELGEGLGLSITKKKKGPKPVREQQISTWVKSIFFKLDKERKSKKYLHPTQISKLQEDEKKYLEGTLLSQNGEPIYWTPENFWKLKAALLPDPSKEHIGKWVEATMAWFESEVASIISKSLPPSTDHKIRKLEQQLTRLKIAYPCQNSQISNKILAKCNCENCQKIAEPITEISELRNSMMGILKRKVKNDFLKHTFPERKDVTSKARLKEFVKKAYLSFFK